MTAAPIWLFTGPEIGLRKDTVEQYREKARKLFGQTDEYTFYAGETRIAEIISLLRNASLFASGRFVILRAAEQIKLKADIELIAAWAAESVKRNTGGEGSWLILESDEVSVDKKLENIIPKENRIVFWEMFEEQKNRWLEDFLKKQGFSADPDAVDTILDLVENNTEALKAECSRFSLCFEKNHRITAEDVEAVLTKSRQESAFTLFAALCEKTDNAARLSGALAILQYIRHSKESSSVQLIAGLAYCFRKLKLWHKLAREGKTSPFDLKINGFSAKKMQTQYRAAAGLWNDFETAACLALLSRTDMNIRQNGKSAEETELQLMLYRLVIHKGKDSALSQVYGV